MEIRAQEIAINPAVIVISECITVTSAMRKHARWAHSSIASILGEPDSTQSRELLAGRGKSPSSAAPFGSDCKSTDDIGAREVAMARRWSPGSKKVKAASENPLMTAFSRLRGSLSGRQDINHLSVPDLLHPFLQVIRSSSTSAPITSLSLIAITKFYAYGFIHERSPELALGTQMLSYALTNCRFEATDTTADELVLLRILKLMEVILEGPGGQLLGDVNVCEMMETSLSICSQKRLTEVLRRSAEMAMISMCQAIFGRLRHLDEVAENGTEPSDGRVSRETAVVTIQSPTEPGPSQLIAMDVSAPNQNMLSPQSSIKAEQEAAEITKRASSKSTERRKSIETPRRKKDTPYKPFSLPAVRELFRVLVQLLDPHDLQHTDTMRVMAMRIINVALEVAGPSIVNHVSLTNVAKNDLCRFLFQLVRTENATILQESLRVAKTLLTTCREVLKLQQELFLSYLAECLHPRIDIPPDDSIDPALYDGVPQAPKLSKPVPPPGSASGRSTPVPVKDRQKLGMQGGTRRPEAREAMVESLSALIRIPSFMLELFVNYDCEVDRADLCEDIVGLLARNAFPDSATWSTTSVPPLCLDALMSYINFMAERLQQDPERDPCPEARVLQDRRNRKKLTIVGATKFNEKPTAGIAFLASKGLIKDPNDPHEVVRFLKSTNRISKTILGEYLSKKSNEFLLSAFVDTFDFRGKRADEALREMLESFRLPGEAMLIERIVEVFAKKYCTPAAPTGIADADAVHILTYAIIMLNTDQHNPNVDAHKRMRQEDFARNLRGTNGGQDFESEYLKEIYDAIKSREIILPEEHDNKFAFDYAWKELLRKTEDSGDLLIIQSNTYDMDMFAATWKPIIATLSYVFLSASDDAVFSTVIRGFHQCARIAAAYGLQEAMDRIVYCLGTMTALATDIPPNTSLNTEVQVKSCKIMVSETAVKFGRDFKAQLATIALFRVVNGGEMTIKRGWEQIVKVWLTLFVNSLMPSYVSMPAATVDLAPIPLQTPSLVIDQAKRNNDASIFSTFTSYLSSYAADEPPEPSDEEIESTLATCECIKACLMEEIFSHVMTLSSETLESLVRTLLSLLPEEQSPIVITVKVEHPGSPTTNGSKPVGKSPIYDPGRLYLLEFATILALRDDETLRLFGRQVGEALHDVIRNAQNTHQTVISRAIQYLLTLTKAGYEHSMVRLPVLLHSLSSLDPRILSRSSVTIAKGVRECIVQTGPLRQEMISSPDFWDLLIKLASSKEAAVVVFSIAQDVAIGNTPAVTSDNYESIVSLLNEFAMAAGAESASQSQVQSQAQKRDQTPNRRGEKRAKPTARVEQDTPVIARGGEAVRVIYQLSSRIPAMIQHSHLSRNQAWEQYYNPILSCLKTQCLNPSNAIRQVSFQSLARILLSPTIIATEDSHWTQIYEKILFDLLQRLLRPEVFQTDPTGITEARTQGATMLCKVFLTHLNDMADASDGQQQVEQVWEGILELMGRLVTSAKGRPAEESMLESLKNVVLVMSSTGCLRQPGEDGAGGKKEEKEGPGTGQGQEDDWAQGMWLFTEKKLNSFLPGLMEELFPAPKSLAVSTGKPGKSPE